MKIQRKEKVRLNVAKLRSALTPDERNAENEKKKESMATKRRSQTDDEKNVEKEKNKESKAARRRSQTPNETKISIWEFEKPRGGVSIFQKSLNLNYLQFYLYKKCLKFKKF